MREILEKDMITGDEKNLKLIRISDKYTGISSSIIFRKCNNFSLEDNHIESVPLKPMYMTKANKKIPLRVPLSTFKPILNRLHMSLYRNDLILYDDKLGILELSSEYFSDDISVIVNIETFLTAEKVVEYTVLGNMEEDSAKLMVELL